MHTGERSSYASCLRGEWGRKLLLVFVAIAGLHRTKVGWTRVATLSIRVLLVRSILLLTIKNLTRATRRSSQELLTFIGCIMQISTGILGCYSSLLVMPT